MNNLRALQKSAGFLRSQSHLIKSNHAAIVSYLPNAQIINNRAMATAETSKNEGEPKQEPKKSGSIGKDLLMIITAGGVIGGVLFAYMEYRESKGL